MNEVLILGAGPAGLAVSHGLGGRARILEKADGIGGLCRSVQFGGGVFDLGGHVFHSPHADVRSLVDSLMAGRWYTQPRDARVWFRGELIGYPFQQHFAALSDAAVVAACRTPPVAASAPRDFEDWIVARFGAGIAGHFMLPYNRKLWARDLRRISHDWVGSRVAGATPGASGGRRPLESDSHIGYPSEGGFEEIFKALAARCGPIECGREMVRVDPVRRLVVTADGHSHAWSQLVSTLPLPELLRRIDGAPDDVLAAAARLEAVSLQLLLVLVASPLAGVPQRVYCADPGIPPHKIAFNHTSSPSLRARPVHAICCEIAYSTDKPALPEAVLQQRTLDWLLAAGFIRHRQDIAEVRLIDVPYAYPVPTHERSAIVTQARRYLADLGIYSIGRFGAWEYANSDDCLQQGLALATRLRTSTGSAS